MKLERKNNAGPRNRTWVCSATTNCTNHYTRPADLEGNYSYIFIMVMSTKLVKKKEKNLAIK